jgi:hypothetical protein
MISDIFIICLKKSFFQYLINNQMERPHTQAYDVKSNLLNIGNHY